MVLVFDRFLEMYIYIDFFSYFQFSVFSFFKALTLILESMIIINLIVLSLNLFLL
jgi:hypothetical protein